MTQDHRQFVWTRDRAYAYDALGRLASVTVTRLNGETPATPQVIAYAYDLQGNLARVIQPNGLATTYTYDVMNRLDLEVVADQGNAVIASYDYQTRADGQRTGVLEHQRNLDGTFADTRVTYAYDADGRLTVETYDVGDDGPDAADLRIAYAFDLANNRTGKTVDQGHDGALDETVVYVYNGNDQLLGEDSSLDAHDRTYAYDANGSQTSVTTGPPGSTSTQGYLWDLRNRMVGFDAAGAASGGGGDGDLNDQGDVVYVYDTQGVRIAQTAVAAGAGGADADTWFLSDPRNPTGYAKAVEEKAAPGDAALPTRSYIFGLRVEGQSDAANGALYFVSDGHGSTRVLVGLPGTLVQRLDYDAYGNPRGFALGEALTPWQFAGDGLRDAASGLTYTLRRWRQANTFISFDTYNGEASHPQSLHKYSYAESNPIITVDPSGNRGLPELLVAVTIISLATALVGHGLNATGHDVAAARTNGVSKLAAGIAMVTVAMPIGLTPFGSYLMLRGVDYCLTGLEQIISGVETPTVVARAYGYYGGSGSSAWNDLILDMPIILVALRDVVNASGVFKRPAAIKAQQKLKSLDHDERASVAPAPRIRTPQEMLMPNGNPIGEIGSNPNIRQLSGQTMAKAEKFFQELTHGGTPASKPNYAFPQMNLQDGGWAGFRTIMADSPGTIANIDISIPGIPFLKLKFNP